MNRTTHAFKTEKEWLDLRKQDITSTEAAGLFGAGAYDNSRTMYELYQIKSGAIDPKDFKSNERTVWGNRLEAAIAAGVAEDLGLIVEPFKVYMRIPEVRIGSSFDFKIVGIVEGFSGDETARDMFRQHGHGIMEVKNIDSLQFKRNWIEEGETIEATAQIEFQVQHQLEVADLEWTLIAPLVGGNTPKTVIRKRDREVGEAIRKAAIALWARVDMGQPPAPDFEKDAGTIGRLYAEDDGSHCDLSGNVRLIELCAIHEAEKARKKDAEDKQKAAKAEILTIIGAHKTTYADMFTVTAGGRKESFRAYHKEAGERWTITKSVIPACDVEATVPGYRDLRIKAA